MIFLINLLILFNSFGSPYITYSVTDFGVVPDDTAFAKSNSEIINQLISGNDSIKQYELFFPPGKYYVSDPIVFNNNSKIYGAGIGLSVISANMDSSYVFTSKNAGVAKGPKDQVKRAEIHHLGITNSGIGGGVILIEGWKNKLYDLELSAAKGVGIKIASSRNTPQELTIRDVRFYRCKVGIFAPGKSEYSLNANDVLVSGCYFDFHDKKNSDGQLNSILVHNAAGWIIQNNHFWSGSKNHAFVFLKEPYHTLISNNYFEKNAGRSSVRLDMGSVSSCVITGNSFWMSQKQTAVSIKTHLYDGLLPKLVSITGNTAIGSIDGTKFINVNNETEADSLNTLSSLTISVAGNALGVDVGGSIRMIGYNEPRVIDLSTIIQKDGQANLPLNLGDNLLLKSTEEESNLLIDIKNKGQLLNDRTVSLTNLTKSTVKLRFSQNTDRKIYKLKPNEVLVFRGESIV
ncbi:MAG: hypothetical protein CMB80_25105, partial [Flammeovirgaceae bacterium]|nr:hypothetical protein [Flammeovirgaceae bacterium]